MKRMLIAAACAAVLVPVAGCGDVGKEVEKAGAAAKGKAGQAADAAKAKAGEVADAAKDLTVGGVNVGAELTAVIDKLKASLSGIKDTQTAEQAVPELKEADTKLDSLLGMADKLPEAARPAFKAMAEKGLAALQPLIDKVLKIEGVGAIVKPVLDAIVAKLKAASAEKT
jgi:hypothetical protein